jgi:hypothetical protein
VFDDLCTVVGHLHFEFALILFCIAMLCLFLACCVATEHDFGELAFLYPFMNMSVRFNFENVNAFSPTLFYPD